MTHLPQKIGDNVHMDILPVPTSVGGNNHILFTVDEKAEFVIGIPIPTKSTPQLVKAADVIVQMYHLRGHTISPFTLDNEINLRAMEPNSEHARFPSQLLQLDCTRKSQNEASKL